jgi:hypothetical protein
MRTRIAADSMVVATVPPQVPVLDAADLPSAEDWALLEALGIDRNVEHDGDVQEDRLGALIFAPGMAE